MQNKEAILEQLNAMCKNTLMEVLDMVFTDVTEDTVTMEMPVDKRHHQPYGLLHGGVSLALAETVGSSGSALFINTKEEMVVGLQLSGNHMKSVREGVVKAVGTIIHKGRSTHLWQIDIYNEKDEVISSSRLTNFIKPIKK